MGWPQRGQAITSTIYSGRLTACRQSKHTQVALFIGVGREQLGYQGESASFWVEAPNSSWFATP